MAEERLEGGLTNTGKVVRSGSHVLRPSGPQTVAVHTLLRALRDAGFDGAPLPIDLNNDGRERLEFIDGDVPHSPYPAWSQSSEALASIARLLRKLHDASTGFDPSGLTWKRDLADPAGAGVLTMCHNDIELSNIVFRGGLAVAFIDFEFAAPGRVVYDLAQFARLCVPIEHDVDQARMGWLPADRPARLRLIADVYELDGPGRVELVSALDDAIDVIESAARRGVEHADEHGRARAAEALAKTGGIEKYDRRRRWWAEHRSEFAAALAAGQ